MLKGEALSDWVSSDSDDLDEFVAEFDNDDQIESVDGYHLAELQADVESDIALLRELRDLAAVVVDGIEPKVAEARRGAHCRSPRRRSASTRAACRTPTAGR